MRVLVVSAWEPWRPGDGATLILRHQLRELADRHELRVLAAGAPSTTSPPPDGAVEDSGSVPMQWFGTSRSAPVDFAVRRLRGLARREPAHVGYVERPQLLAEIEAQQQKWQPDLVYAFGWGTAQLWQHTDRPVVHFAVDAWHRNAGNRRLGTWHRLAGVGELATIRRHESRHYPHLSAVVVVAPADATAVNALAPHARVVVIANGVEAGPAPKPVPSEPVIGFHGAFAAQHNVDAARTLAREVLPLVRAARPDARLLLAGRDPGPDVQSLAGPDVEVVADPAQMRPVLDRVAVYCAPITSGAGLKNKVLEALAAGRPVVTTPEGADGIGAGPGVTVAADPPGLAAAVTELLADHGQAAADGLAGRQRVVHEFSWRGNAAALEQVWTAALR
jgi:glycosyltransferase involved in cell wall biosynthesis